MTMLWYAAGISADDQEFTSDAPGGNGVAYGPVSTLNASAELVGLRLLVYNRPNMNTVAGEITYKRGATWQTEVSETGSAQLVIGLEDPMLPLGDDQLIAIETFGQVVMSVVPDADDQISVSQQGEGARQVTVQCKGHGWVLNEGVVAPSRGADSWPIEDDRIFSWAMPDYSLSWFAPVRVLTSGITDYWYGPTNWPGGLSSSAYGSWIWGDTGTLTWARTGSCYFRKDFTATTAGIYTFVMMADDWAQLYVDGQRVLVTQGWTNSNDDIYQIDVPLSAGTHTVAIDAYNNPGQVGNNPAGIRAVVARNMGDGYLGTVVAKTDASWVVSSYPVVLGVSPGLVVRKVVEEAQARGALAGVTLNFDDGFDSDGLRWPWPNEISTKVGNSILTLLRELSDTYIDWRMNPSSLELSMWIKGGQGGPTGHVFRPPTDPNNPLSGNVTNLRHRRQR